MNKNILVVDDSLTARRIIGFFLKDSGYKTIDAKNGIEALEKMTRCPIDLVITDLNMPKMDGIELINSIKNDPNFKTIPVIIVTTEKEDDQKEKGMKSGASAYLEKPVTKNMLIKEVDSFLRM